MELLQLEQPIENLRKALAAFEWDSEELVFLNKGHVGSVLKRFMSGQLPTQAVRAWAEAIEGRDDIGFESGAAAFLKQTIFELANPEFTVPLTPRRAQQLVEELR